METSKNPLMRKRLIKTVDLNGTLLTFWTGYTAEVSMVSATQDADRVIALGMRGFSGVYGDRITEEEIAKWCAEAGKTKLVPPLEWVNFVFLLRNVPRYFTHQLVRTRVGASFVQESTRFWLEKPTYDFLLPRELGELDPEPAIESVITTIRNVQQLQKNPQIRAEDIRSMLPHSVLTHVFWQINLRALLGIYENRFCCQAEATVWLPLLIDIRKKIKAWNPRIEALISSPYERGENCGYNSSLDRPCAWRKAGTWNL